MTGETLLADGGLTVLFPSAVARPTDDWTRRRQQCQLGPLARRRIPRLDSPGGKHEQALVCSRGARRRGPIARRLARRLVGPAHGRRRSRHAEGRCRAGNPPAQPGHPDVRLGGGPVPALVGRSHQVDSVRRDRARSRDVLDRLEGQQDVDVQAPERRQVLQRRRADRNRRRQHVQLLPRPEDGVAGEEQNRHGPDDHRRESDHGGVQAEDRERPVPDGDHQRQDREDGRSGELQQEPDHDGPVQGRSRSCPTRP